MTALREQYRFGAPVGRARASCAFTLVEVLIAIAILGVGITMAAALFPTAIKQNQRSANDTIGMIVAKNALAVVKARLTAASIISSTLTPVGGLTEADLTYPVPREPRANFPGDWDGVPLRPVALRGAMVLARRIQPDPANLDPNRNDFQLVIVSFAKQRSVNTIEAVGPVNATIVQQPTWDWAELRVTGSADERASLQRGGVVIFGDDGAFARIRAVQPGSGVAVLDRKFDDGDLAGLNAQDIWLIVERYDTPPAPPAPDVVGAWSPVTSVLVTRTALRN